MFWDRKTKPTEPTVTIEDILAAWPLWLASGRPPFEWFMACDADVQEALAEIGGSFSECRDLERATALAAPDLAEACVSAADDPTDTAASATVLQHVLAAAADRVRNGSDAAVGQSEAPAAAPAPLSWGQVQENQKRAAARMADKSSPNDIRAAIPSLPGGDR